MDAFIHPELETAQAVVRLVRQSRATDLIDFADGQIRLLGARLEEDSPLLRTPLEDLGKRKGHPPVSTDYELWSFSAQFILFGLMFIGGCAGSTGGGLKVMRVHLLVKFVVREVTRLIHPRAVVPVRLSGSAVDRDIVTNVLGFFVLFMISFGAGVFVMSEVGMDMPTSFGAVAATWGNIGPGLGDVGPTDNYSAVPAAGKWVLSLLMLMGRLEIYTVIVLLSPATWQR